MKHKSQENKTPASQRRKKALSDEEKFRLVRKQEKAINSRIKAEILSKRASQDLKDAVLEVRRLKDAFLSKDYSKEEFEQFLEGEYTEKVNDLLKKQYIYWEVSESLKRKNTIPTFRLSEPKEWKKRIEYTSGDDESDNESDSGSDEESGSSNSEEDAGARRTPTLSPKAKNAPRASKPNEKIKRYPSPTLTSGSESASSDEENLKKKQIDNPASQSRTLVKSRKRKANGGTPQPQPEKPAIRATSQNGSLSDLSSFDDDAGRANESRQQVPLKQAAPAPSKAASSNNALSSDGDSDDTNEDRQQEPRRVSPPPQRKHSSSTTSSTSDATNPAVKEESFAKKPKQMENDNADVSGSEMGDSESEDYVKPDPNPAATAKRSTIGRNPFALKEDSDESDAESLLEEEELEESDHDSFIVKEDDDEHTQAVNHDTEDSDDDEEELDAEAHGLVPESPLSEDNRQRNKRKRSASPNPSPRRRNKKPKVNNDDALSVDVDAGSSDDDDMEVPQPRKVKKFASESEEESDAKFVEADEYSNPDGDFAEEVLSADEMNEEKVREIHNAEIQSISDSSEDDTPHTIKKKTNQKTRQTKLLVTKPKKPLDAAGRRKKLEKDAKKLEKLQKKRERMLQSVNNKDDVPDELRVVNPASDGDQILIPKELFQFMKPHQVEGIQFLWDRVWEKENNMRGAILAHSMGLGKTLQAVSFIHMSASNMKSQHALVVCPKSVVENWKDEFHKWLGDEAPDLYVMDSGDNDERKHDIESFEETGGVFIISQNMLAKLLSPNSKPPKYKDASKGESYKELQVAAKRVFTTVVDLCVVDEGHMISKEKNHLTQALNTLKTRNRVVLTGTPLQNHLKEMFQLINWVRPLHWSQTFFNNFYANPIKDGMKKDSSKFEVGLMKRRSFLLIKKLKAFVDRKNVDILKAELPPKTELVIGCRMTDFQRDLYASFLNCNRDVAQVSGQLFYMWHTVMKIVNHPDIVRNFMKKKNLTPHSEADHDYKWTAPLFETHYKPYDAERCTKMKLALQIIESCINEGEKILVFSQFTDTLSLLEEVLGSTELTIHGRKKKLKKNSDWYRLDGSSSTKKRHTMVTDFNTKKDVSVFFISTKAGGMGINLTGATRILIYDVLWNPMWNSQALFRSYRYGQKKSVFVYRLCTVDCIEEVLWSRCTAKSWLFEKVVNDTNPTRSITFADLELQPSVEENDKSNLDPEAFKHDKVFRDAYEKMKRIIRDVYSYDSLYEEDLDDKLTDEERAQAEAEEERYKNVETSDHFVDTASLSLRMTMENDDDDIAALNRAGPSKGHNSVFLQELMEGEFQRVAPKSSKDSVTQMLGGPTARFQLPTGNRSVSTGDAHASMMGGFSSAPSPIATPSYLSALGLTGRLSATNGSGVNGTTHRPSSSHASTNGAPKVPTPSFTTNFRSSALPLGATPSAPKGDGLHMFRYDPATGGNVPMVFGGPISMKNAPYMRGMPQLPTSHQKAPTVSRASTSNLEDIADQYAFASANERKELLRQHPGLQAVLHKRGEL